MDIAVVKFSGAQAGRNVSLSQDVFGIEPNDQAI